MKLSEAGVKGGNAHKHKWTDDERQIVRRDYQGTNESAKRIAGKLGVSFNAVKGQVGKMGISFRPDMKQWTQKEEERLAELITQFVPHLVAKRMKRSINSVVVKSKKLGFSRRTRDGWYTKREVCNILGVDHHWVQARIDNGALKASWHNGVKPQKNGGACWHILESDLKEFIRKCPDELHGRNVDIFQIVEILAGVLWS